VTTTPPSPADRGAAGALLAVAGSNVRGTTSPAPATCRSRSSRTDRALLRDWNSSNPASVWPHPAQAPPPGSRSRTCAEMLELGHPCSVKPRRVSAESRGALPPRSVQPPQPFWQLPTLQQKERCDFNRRPRPDSDSLEGSAAEMPPQSHQSEPGLDALNPGARISQRGTLNFFYLKSAHASSGCFHPRKRTQRWWIPEAFLPRTSLSCSLGNGAPVGPIQSSAPVGLICSAKPRSAGWSGRLHHHAGCHVDRPAPPIDGGGPAQPQPNPTNRRPESRREDELATVGPSPAVSVLITNSANTPEPAETRKKAEADLERHKSHHSRLKTSPMPTAGSETRTPPAQRRRELAVCSTFQTTQQGLTNIGV